MELYGRIKESFGLEGNALKVTPELTLTALALLIHKAVKKAEAAASDQVNLWGFLAIGGESPWLSHMPLFC